MQDVSPQALIHPSIALEPRRGLLPLHNVQGKPFRPTDLHRGMAYATRAYQVLKLDVLTHATISTSQLSDLLAYAREVSLPLSLRTRGEGPVPELRQLKGEGLFDLHLAGLAEDSTGWIPWMEAAHAADLSIRITLAGGGPVDTGRWAELGVRAATLVQREAFLPAPSTIAIPSEVLDKLRASGVDAVQLLDEAAYFVDHQQYDHAAYVFAEGLWRSSPRAVRSALVLKQIERSGFQSKADRWLTYALRMYAPALFPVASAGARAVRALAPIANKVIPTTAESTASEPRYFDAIDRDRLQGDAVLLELAEEARALAASGEPGHVFDSGEWGFENAFHDPMPGVNQMHALLPGEKRSTKLPWLRAPFLVTVSLGGGMAEFAGFAIGRHIRIVCPMLSTSHQLSLYADAAGRYVLLRDGHPVRPSLRYGAAYTPARLPEAMHLQIAIVDPEQSMGITSVRAWEGASLPEQPVPKVSVVFFSARYARRLQAALLSVVHQQGLPTEAIEIIVGYVPGLDGTEDLLDSLQRAHPSLRLVRVAFPEAMAKSKGFCINACLQSVSAPLIALLDSDILLPPPFLARAVEASAEHGFIAPAGRALLDAETTARVLLGETAPWAEFDALSEAAPEFRVEENPQQVPLGYCQVFRASALEHVRYAEYDHFQGADFEFGEALMRHFGGAHRMAERVLHLDHEGRQWYGAQKQF